MRAYFGFFSIILFIFTFLVMEFFIIGNVAGPTDMTILLSGIGAAVLLALFSKKGRLKTILLSLYGILFTGYAAIVILFATSHM